MKDATRLLYAVSGLSLFLSACFHDAPPPTLVPSGPTVTRIEDLGGKYCWYGIDYNVRTYRQGVQRIPFFDFESLEGPTLLTVRAEKDRVVFVSPGQEGRIRVHVFDVSQAGGQWQGASLLIPPVVSPGLTVRSLNPKGASYTRSGMPSRLFRLADGRLVMTTSFVEKGIHFTPDSEKGDLKPSWNEKEDSVVVILDPAAGSCDADPTGRPLQPLFEPGLDIRVPACVSTLEERVASILVEKGETPEAAADVARETVQGLTSAAAAGRFEVRTRSDDVTRSYSFHVSESSGSCTLRLSGRGKRTKNTSSNWPSFASRPLPGCNCVD